MTLPFMFNNIQIKDPKNEKINEDILYWISDLMLTKKVIYLMP